MGTRTQKLRRAPGLLILGISREISFDDQMQWRNLWVISDSFKLQNK